MNPESHAHGDLARPASASAVPAPAAQGGRGVSASRPGPAGLPQGQAAAVTPLGLLRALRRRSALALGVALLAAAIAGPVAWFVVPSALFRAEARLLLAAQPPKVLFQTGDNGGGDYHQYQNTQKTLIKSHLVLAAALSDSKVSRYRTIREQPEPIEWLKSKLNVEFVGGSEVMEISLSGDDPVELAGIVNAVKQAYIDEVVNYDLKRRKDRFDKLKEIKDKYTELLTKRRQTMRKLAEAVGSDDRQTLALRQQYAMEHLQYLQKELLDVQSQRRKLEARLGIVRPGESGELAAEPAPLTEPEIGRLVDQHPAVAGLADRLAELEQKLDMEKAKVGRLARIPTAEPSLRNLTRMVQETRRLLVQRRQEVRPEVLRRSRQPGVDDGNGPGTMPGQELAMLAGLEQRLNEEIKSIQILNKSLTVNTLDLQSNQEEVAQMEAAANSVAREVEALTIELEAPPRIRLIDDATPPQTRDNKKRYMMVGMITFGSFFGGLFGIAFLELQTRKVDTADEVISELGLSVVGALPMLPARGQRRGLMARREDEKDRYWRNVLLESVDATRTLLLHAARTGAYRVMMVTSAISGEGKTSLASYLATSLARSGLRTLLIDADLRRPMMHQLFERPAGPGLSELLRGEVDLDEAIGPTAVEGLELLPAGRCDRQALRGLSQGGAAPLIDRLKPRFDFIIVDTSPILPVADAMLVAQYVDAALFSIFSDVSRKAKVKAAVERLERLGVPVLGAVVTGTHGGLYGNHYYDRYASYTGLPESVAASSEGLS